MSSLDKYKPNSDRAKEETAKHTASPEEKGVHKIIDPIEVRKPSKAREISGMFIKNDAKTVTDNIVFDVIIPSLTDMLLEGLHSAIDMFFGGRSSSRRSGRYNDRRGSRISYARYYDDDDRPRKRHHYEEEPPRRQRYSNRVDEIVVGSKWKAQEVLDDMERCIEEFDVVSVKDLYKMVGIEGDWTTDGWGWTDISDAYIKTLRGGGYEIVLPKPKKI